MYREPEETWTEKCVAYDHDLLMAADEVISRMEDMVYDDTCKDLIRTYAKEYNVGKKDLKARVLELIE
jgi:hypothetical protein